MTIRSLRTFVFCSVLTACSTGGWVGPEGRTDYVELARSFTPTSAVIERAMPASWIPDRYGFQQRLDGEAAYSGLVVMTAQSLAFAMWDREAQKHVPYLSIPYAEIKALSIESYGLNRRVRFSANQRFHSFSVVNTNNGLIDAEATEGAYGHLRAKVI